MNSSDAVRMKVQGTSDIQDDDDLKTPTVEELAFPGHKAVSIRIQHHIMVNIIETASQICKAGLR